MSHKFQLIPQMRLHTMNISTESEIYHARQKVFEFNIDEVNNSRRVFLNLKPVRSGACRMHAILKCA